MRLLHFWSVIFFSYFISANSLEAELSSVSDDWSQWTAVFSASGNIYVRSAPGPLASTFPRPQPELCPARPASKQTEYGSPETLSRPLIGHSIMILSSDWLTPADPERVPTSETEIWRTISIVAKFRKIFPWKILKHNSLEATWQCFSCWH